ncbi:DDE family transposase [Yoonia sediminilitoris]|uniref:DDE family transposase n=1 Tax=Yoonia sediminilitoris TaxID=1286148 RepID=A0A2T6KAH8_9RHOB|nr:DDE family transposase [Yoonia sediminilitoris]RCW91910.1 DDE family transposase [Yoonia sediminilitoris]
MPNGYWLIGAMIQMVPGSLGRQGNASLHPTRNKVVRYDKRRYRSRNRIERLCGRLKDWRRVSTRYDRCPIVFLSAIALAATVIFWLCRLTPGQHRK